MFFHQMARDGQPESGAFANAARGRSSLIKFVENRFVLFTRNADPCIAYRKTAGTRILNRRLA